jgi:hypothetical protein
MTIKPLKIIFLALFLYLIPFQANAGEPFAIVELYTSEGCSSCPIADRILYSLEQEARNKNMNLYTLGFHVDYWDYLGWKDPFSQSSFSHRQRTYSKKLNTRSVYTPQMIVNGTSEFGGYDQNLARKHINEALAIESTATVDLTVDFISEKNIGIKYNLSKIPENYYLQIALVKRAVTTQVRRGENAGKTLKHANAVVMFKSVDIASERGKFEFAKPNDFNKNESSIIAFIQHKNNAKIIAANMTNL